jgi:hypothetical protein
MSASVIAALPAGLERTQYIRHDLHSPERLWTEKNCYIDIWIELVHALRLDPYAMLPFTVAVDFEGDQWTFFKPPHEDLKRVYGLDVQELYVWRPLLEHALEHLKAGKLISTEADAFWLPDTAGSDYRSTHTKTTIVLERIDLEARQLGYFHNAGYFTLEGEDFVQTFRLNAPPDPAFMPMFAELVRYDRAAVLDPRVLRERSRELLRKHIAWRPQVNPIPRFRERFERDLPELSRQGMGAYHAWVFGTVRQLGAASELAALYLRWLDSGPDTPAAAAAQPFLDISTVCKSLVLKVARAVNSRRPLDASASFEQLTSAWELANSALRGLT